MIDSGSSFEIGRVWRRIGTGGIRFLCYGTYLGLLLAMVLGGAAAMPMVDGRKPMFQEGGLVEMLQLTHVATATVLFAGQAVRGAWFPPTGPPASARARSATV